MTSKQIHLSDGLDTLPFVVVAVSRIQYLFSAHPIYLPYFVPEFSETMLCLRGRTQTNLVFSIILWIQNIGNNVTEMNWVLN